MLGTCSCDGAFLGSRRRKARPLGPVLSHTKGSGDVRTSSEVLHERRVALMKRKLLIGAGITGAVVLLTAVAAGAQEDVDPVKAVADLGIQANLLWVVIGAVLVIFMQ